MGLKEKIILISTGGTIEKSYDEVEGTLHNRETIIKDRIIKKLRLPYTSIEIKSIMAKDSLDLTDQDRKIIAESINKFCRLGHPLVILHGTDTMDQTISYCSKAIKDIPVPVVFTGAMKPLGFEDSDALQNVIEALTSAKILGPGFYLAFHNKVFIGSSFKKNKSLKTFELI